MNYAERIIGDIELHDAHGIRECFSNGVNPNGLWRGQPLIYELLGGYLRGSGFRECVQTFVDFGLDFEDNPLLSVLLDDPISLIKYVHQKPETVHFQYSFRAAFTPLFKVTLLHICAEFNHVKCAQVLVDNGAEINARAGVDKYGFGGQSPIFHSVNQNLNKSAQMMDFLLSESADLSLSVKGLIWGQGNDWETLIPAVNPISYAMMGLLPQMHRDEKTISETVLKLLKKEFDIDYQVKNVPNKYLRK